MSFSPLITDPYVGVGKSGLRVFAVGLGTMQFGWSVDEAGSQAVMDTYVAAGGNFIDTADCYSSWSESMGGPPNAGGVSEEIIGRWMTSRGNREDLVVATKVRAPMGTQFADTRSTFRQREGLSRRWIFRACEDSLRRLGTDHIDLYQAHFLDPLVPIEETMSAFNDLVRRGLVRYIGVSNFSAWRLMQALWTADTNGFESIVSIQPEFSLLPEVRANFERELAAVCLEYGVGVLPYSPLAGGMLTGKYRRGQALPDSVRAEENAARLEQNLDTIELLVSVAERNEMTPSQAAIAWTRSRPFVSAPIVGANRPEQLTEVLDGLSKRLPVEDVDALNTISGWSQSRAELES